MQNSWDLLICMSTPTSTDQLYRWVSVYRVHVLCCLVSPNLWPAKTGHKLGLAVQCELVSQFVTECIISFFLSAFAFPRLTPWCLRLCCDEATYHGAGDEATYHGAIPRSMTNRCCVGTRVLLYAAWTYTFRLPPGKICNVAYVMHAI